MDNVSRRKHLRIRKAINRAARNVKLKRSLNKSSLSLRLSYWKEMELRRMPAYRAILHWMGLP